jgi:CubicO group peptidase (beta-lactamase class C family)
VRRLAFGVTVTLLSCAAAGSAPVGVPPAIPGPVLESAPAGRALAHWLAAYNTGRLDSVEVAIARLYATSALTRRPASARAASLTLWFRNYGTLTPVRVDSLTTSAVVATVREGLTGGWGIIYLDVDSVAPHRVTGVSLLPFTEPADWSELRVANEAALVAQVRDLADRLARADAFSGVVFLTRGGRPLLREAFGLANRETGRRNTADTRFELASVSKMFTAVAVLQQVEAGTLTLDATIGSQLPDFPAESPASQVTIHQLLTMSSGIPDLFGVPRYWAERGSIRTLSDYWRFFAKAPLEFVPGTAWSYSNSNFLLLGAVVERLTGLRFPDAVSQRVFAPAGMTGTGYRAGPGALPARGYTHSRPGSAPGATPDPDRWYPSGEEGDTSAGSPAGGGVSTAEDLTRFARALMEGRLLGRELTRRAMTGYVATEYGGKDGYGLETRSWNGVRIMGHGGGFSGVSNQVDFYPDLGYVLVVLGNSDASGAQAIASRVRGILASSPSLTEGARFR